MDIGKIIEVGEREVPMWRPAPTMIPATPEHGDTPEPRRESTPEREPERIPA